MISLDDLIQLIATALEIDIALLDENTTAESIESWDSIGHITILSLLEDTTPGTLDALPDLAAANSVQALWTLLKQK
jgi:hypothetical protein